MKTIRDYLESLFLGIPDSVQKEQLKADLLANMEDRYQELVAQGKGEHEAIGITITEFGSLDELLADLELSQEKSTDFTEETDEWHDPISMEEAFNFLEIYRRSSLKIGLGILFCLVGVGQVIFWEISNSELLGLFLMFVFIAIAVSLFIVAGMALSNSAKSLDDRSIPRNVAQEVTIEKEKFRRSFSVSITLGVLIIILSVGLVFIGEMIGSEEFGVTAFLIGVGFGVLLLVYGGMVHSSFEKLTTDRIFVADEDEPGPRARREKNLPPLLVFINGFYWPLVLAIFFVGGFIFDAWGISWLVFPIAGVLYGSLNNAFER